MTPDFLTLRADLERLRSEGSFDPDIDAAYFDLGRALDQRSGMPRAVMFAQEVLARYDAAYRQQAKVSARTITKAEHDAMLDGPQPKGVSREEYERMMREAQRD